MVAAFAICPAAVSCYDDSALQEQIDMLVDKVYELEIVLHHADCLGHVTWKPLYVHKNLPIESKS